MRLGQAAALKVGHGSANAGVVFNDSGADLFLTAQARLHKYFYLYGDGRAKFATHKRAAYEVAAGVGAEW